MPDITINGISVDPQAPAPAGLALAPGVDFKDTSRTNYILVQTRAPLNKADRARLESLGVEIIEYVPENTYIARFEPESLAPVTRLAFVEWAGPYLPGFKIPAALSPRRSSRLALAAAAVPFAPVLSDASTEVNVVFHQGADAKAAARKVAVAAGVDPDDLKPSGNKVRVRVTLRRMADVAALDDVRHVEESVPVTLHNDVARQVLKIDSANPGSLPYEGEGQIVAVCDTGFDKGSTTNTHPAFGGRVRKLYAMGRPGKANDPHGHGTHVAGSVLGDGTSASLGRVRGTAPRAQLVLQSVLDSNAGLGGLPADLRDLFEVPYRDDGARIHTNSWGNTIGDGRYDSRCAELDEFVWGHRDMVVCFAAGNAGRDTDHDGIVDVGSVTPPGTAKNCITVGACENDRPGRPETYGAWWPASFPSNPINSDRVANDPNGLAAFSGRGPTRNQRFKPDVVAPGTFILSARSRDTAGDAWGPSSDPNYYFMGGTSMATPLAAGCVALVREFLSKRPQNPIGNPSAALVKALLINGAANIPGQYQPTEAGTIPNSGEGFGRIDMRATLDASRLVVVQDEAGALDASEEQEFQVIVPPGAGTLKATLVWTDPPGEALQNDLDLLVVAGGQERHGNMAPTSKVFDRVNNVEQVTWEAPPAGPATISVRAFRITRWEQTFAIVVGIA